MRFWILAIAAVVLGVGLGIGTTVAEFWSARELLYKDGTLPSASDEAVAPSGPPAKVEVVGGGKFDFGAMQAHETRAHEFTIRNIGEGPLTLSLIGTTCQCTVAGLEKGAVPPGGESQVKLEWKTQDLTDAYEHSAELRTNDPDYPVVRLTIRGRVLAPARADPAEIELGSIRASQDDESSDVARREVKLFGYMPKPLAVIGHSLTNSESKDQFQVSVAPMSADVLAQEPDARSGLVLSLTVKSGLPLGTIRQTIRLETSAPGAETIEIPIYGLVEGDLSLAYVRGAKDFVADLSVLRLGKLQRGKGAEVQMYVLVKGKHRKTTKISVEKTEPAQALLAELGAASEIGNGNVMRYPLVIRVSPDSPAISRMGGTAEGLGNIVLRTDHPVTKEVRLHVQFAIE
jgi:hypothetical protein